MKLLILALAPLSLFAASAKQTKDDDAADKPPTVAMGSQGSDYSEAETVEDRDFDALFARLEGNASGEGKSWKLILDAEGAGKHLLIHVREDGGERIIGIISEEDKERLDRFKDRMEMQSEGKDVTEPEETGASGKSS